jgi:hypothetical protein
MGRAPPSYGWRPLPPHPAPEEGGAGSIPAIPNARKQTLSPPLAIRNEARSFRTGPLSSPSLHSSRSLALPLSLSLSPGPFARAAAAPFPPPPTHAPAREAHDCHGPLCTSTISPQLGPVRFPRSPTASQLASRPADRLAGQGRKSRGWRAAMPTGGWVTRREGRRRGGPSRAAGPGGVGRAWRRVSRMSLCTSGSRRPSIAPGLTRRRSCLRRGGRLSAQFRVGGVEQSVLALSLLRTPPRAAKRGPGPFTRSSHRARRRAWAPGCA